MTTSLFHVSLSYGDKKIINDLNIEFQDASFNLLIGPSGIGKSTFLRILAGFYPQIEGKVIVADKAIDSLPANRRARYVGFLFQDPLLLIKRLIVCRPIGGLDMLVFCFKIQILNLP